MATQIIKYIGRTTNFEGKTLWEIVGNLKNYGVGRVFIRNGQQRYPEPSFMRIIKVETQPNDNPRKVKVWVDKTFRGKKMPNPVAMFSSSYKADFKLIPKDKEAEVCKVTKSITVKAVTDKLEFPPLLKEVMIRDYAKKGLKFDENLKLRVIYQKGSNTNVKVCEEECQKTVLPIGIGKPSGSIYSNI